MTAIYRGTDSALPTEAEWEYAARAGSRTNICNGDSLYDLKEVGWV